MFRLSDQSKTAMAGAAAGIINGLFGAGGGMVLVPLLRKANTLEEREVFSASVSIILPMCAVSLCVAATQAPLPWRDAFPYLVGSALGGLAAGFLGSRIRTVWLHRCLGILIIYGGWRYLC